MLHTPINNNVPSRMLLIQVLDCDMSVIQQSKKKRKKTIKTILQPHLVHNWEYFITDKYIAGIILGQGFTKHNPGGYGMHLEVV